MSVYDTDWSYEVHDLQSKIRWLEDRVRSLELDQQDEQARRQKLGHRLSNLEEFVNQLGVT